MLLLIYYLKKKLFKWFSETFSSFFITSRIRGASNMNEELNIRIQLSPRGWSIKTQILTLAM